ncbi:unnamed protein product [Rhizophagus irregularis]|nr:unnamed protein product [Rhizophagus irregularis]
MSLRHITNLDQGGESTRSLKIPRSHFHDQNNKRKFVGGNIEDDNDNKDENVKRAKINKNNDYLTKELEFDIDNDINSSKSNNNNYTTKEITFDI